MLEAIALKCLSRVSSGASADHRAGVVDEISLHVYRVARFDEERMHPHAGPVSVAVIGQLG